MRAIAALGVLAFHAATISGNTRVGPGHAYLLHLDVGVAVFFVLSGFLLYRPFLLAHVGCGPAPHVGRYARRRALRIFPAYWLALTVTVYVLHQARVSDLTDFVVLYGLLQIYSVRHFFGGLVQAWSLATEVAFYAFLPVYAWILGRGGATRDPTAQLRREGVGLVILYGISVVFRLGLLSRHTTIGYAWLPAFLDWFALGMGLAVVTVRAVATPGVRPGPAARLFAGPPALLWTAAAMLFVALANLGLPQGFDPITTAQYMQRQLLGGCIAVLLVAPAVVAPLRGGAVRSFLRNRVMVGLGLVSYGIFLWHLPWLDRVAEWISHRLGPPATFWQLLPPALAATLVTAVLSYIALERPLLDPRRGKRP